MLKRNELKNLIYIQDGKPCNKQTVRSLFRAIVEPILEKNSDSLVMLRLEEKSKKDFSSLIKRLSFSNAKVYDFSTEPIDNAFENILKEDIWEKTEFLYVLTERYGAVFVFDYEISDIEGFASIYTLYNSKDLSISFEAIDENSKVELKKYQDEWHPDRRNNDSLNLSITKLIEGLNETNQEIIISEKEKELAQDTIDVEAVLNFISSKTSHVAHEIRNQLSICSLYSDIIQKQLHKVQFNDEQTENSFNNALNCIQKSLKLSGNLLFELKSVEKNEPKEHSLENIINSAVELSQVYINDKNIIIKNENKENTNVLVDSDKLLAVLINLVKNAVESIESKGEINIEVITDENNKIIISNNGEPIDEKIQERIFEEGFSTKPSGSGLGLSICKKSIEEQSGRFRLKKSDEKSTEFEITLPKI